jgi:hemoglobin-like flavoprotein
MKLNPTRDSRAITPFDALHIQDSFRAVKQRSGPATERFFQELFSYDASLKEHFPRDRWRREEVLIEILEQIVGQMNSTGEVAVRLKEIARAHPTYLLNNYHHLYFGAALFSMLEVVLSARFKVVYASWFKLFEQVVREMKAHAAASGVKPAEREEHSFANATAA